MGNMGTIPATGYESSVVQTFSSPTGTSHTMTYTASVNDMILVINNVIQEPTVAYTTSGTTLTTGTLVSSDTMYIVYLALTRQTVAPGADTVTNAMIVDNAINSEHYTDGSIDLAHMSVNSIDSDQYVDASIDNAHLADDAVGVDELSATGTASSSTFLRGDNAWAAGGRIVQVVNVISGAVATGTTIMPIDDTIPQNDEGTEFMTLAITPTSATNKLLIAVSITWSNSAAVTQSVALFQDSTASAIASIMHYITTATVPMSWAFNHFMTTGTTSETTFKIRMGGHSSGTTTFNGYSSARKHGAIEKSSLTIVEIQV